jgi:hypothetical protein
VFAGTGASGQPLRILTTPGVGTQSGTSLGWAGIAAMVEALEVANVDTSSIGWAVPPAVAELMRTRPVLTDAGPILADGRMAGYAAGVTTKAPAATLIGADWSNLNVVDWGVLESAVDPFSGYRTGTVSLRAILRTDLIIAPPSAIVVASTIT